MVTSRPHRFIKLRGPDTGRAKAFNFGKGHRVPAIIDYAVLRIDMGAPRASHASWYRREAKQPVKIHLDPITKQAGINARAHRFSGMSFQPFGLGDALGRIEPWLSHITILGGLRFNPRCIAVMCRLPRLQLSRPAQIREHTVSPWCMAEHSPLTPQQNILRLNLCHRPHQSQDGLWTSQHPPKLPRREESQDSLRQHRITHRKGSCIYPAVCSANRKVLLWVGEGGCCHSLNIGSFGLTRMRLL